MLDLTIYKQRYYQIKLSDNDIINVEPPKRKQLKKILELTKCMNNDDLTEDDIEKLYEACLLAFNKNKEKREFNIDELDEILDLSSLLAFFDGYYSWIEKNIDQKN